MTIHKGRSCCRNGIFLSVQLISHFKNYQCSELGFSPYLLGVFFVPRSYGNLVSPSAKHLQVL